MAHKFGIIPRSEKLIRSGKKYAGPEHIHLAMMLERFDETLERTCKDCVHYRNSYCYLFHQVFMPKARLSDVPKWRGGYPACGKFMKLGEAPIRTAIQRAAAFERAKVKTLFDKE